MINSETQQMLKKQINECIKNNKEILKNLRKEVLELKNKVITIRPRNTTSIALVATDGGNNKFKFDPFLIHILRVVDSNNNEIFLNVLVNEINIHDLSNFHLSRNDVLGRLMKELGVDDLSKLSHMLKPNKNGKLTRLGWINDYRNIIEWAVLYEMITKKDYISDTLLIFDGLLRSKSFWPEIFKTIINKIQNAIEEHKKKKRNLYIVGVAKHTQILEQYRLAMYLENILNKNYPAYVEIPYSIEEKVFKYQEWRTPNDEQINKKQFNEFSAGRMFLSKFGKNPFDPIWAVDIFAFQKEEHQKIMGFLLADALNGFPVPYYPLALQEAHKNAALVDFDFDIIQDYIYEAFRDILGNKQDILDILELMDLDPASKRY